jgi:uncharacterized protein
VSSPRRFVAQVFRAYKTYVSPAIPPACRFHPTCSEYAAEAVEAHGVGYGLYLTMRRLLRCNPWCRGGFDPVPAPRRRAGEPCR